ncbi:NADH-quinone oxidoreductase subunit K [Sediminivirga luteola]|uniref:Multisubunit sodium/proton antiporter MrpC subunit n=1 Tax=Sediminivirga luteola TaxID=1774748 RepID=A0A8J2U0A1_9MICO|nr:NADH-quinone oxidoreductase subunit K [Sediminivirga luteola]MCI2265356.1 NADH-quinone oxidoreductase subunit K [Sediminivirga luteola]GGA24579.1 hypothetical protein GCM10011333_29520 [Sediminivirga luteola]
MTVSGLPELMTVLACAVLVIGLSAHLLVADLFRRIISLNVASGGVMMLLLVLAVRGPGDQDPDPVPQALVLTGIVIMAAVTGLALALARRVEDPADEDDRDEETP